MRSTVTLAGALMCGLAACAPERETRYLLSGAADPNGLMVIDKLVPVGDRRRLATLVYSVGRDDAGRPAMQQFMVVSEVDCRRRMERTGKLILAAPGDSEPVDLPFIRDWQAPRADTLGGDRLRIACDPAFAATRVTRKSWNALKRDWARSQGRG